MKRRAWSVPSSFPSFARGQSLTGNGKRNLAQVSSSQSQIDGGALRCAVTKDISDCLEGRSVPEQLKRERVTEAMRAIERDFRSTSAQQRLKGFCNCRGFQYADGCAHPKEHPPVRRRWRRPLQVFYEGGRHLVC